MAADFQAPTTEATQVIENEESSAEFRYYMVRLQSGPAPEGSSADPMLAGIVERIGSGEKRNFADAAELVRHMAHWSDGAPNMSGGADVGNA